MDQLGWLEALAKATKGEAGKHSMAMRILEHALKLGFTEEQIMEAFEDELHKQAKKSSD